MKWLILQKATPTLRTLSVGVAFWLVAHQLVSRTTAFEGICNKSDIPRSADRHMLRGFPRWAHKQPVINFPLNQQYDREASLDHSLLC